HAPMRRLLLIRPDHLGDLLFLTPALRHLRALLPDAHLSLLVGPWGEEVMRHNPHLDEVLVCEFPGFTRQPKPSVWQPYRLLRREARRLREHRFDAAIVLRFDHWWGAWLAAAAGIPRRYGYAIPEVTPFLTDPLPYHPRRHEVEQNWRLVHFAWSRGTLPVVEWWSEPDIIGPLEYAIPAEAQAWAEGWLSRHLPGSELPVVLHPGAGAAVKLWRAEAWVALGRALAARFGVPLLLTGSPAEAGLCRRIAAQIAPSPAVAAGETTLPQLAALLARARLVIGPDTGPLKLAAAVGAPTLQLYGPVDAVKFGPWGDPARHAVVSAGLACSPCNHLDFAPAEVGAHFCVRGISVEAVLGHAARLLAGAKSHR
ncbi:MAG: glycosyltransferase family 9 protein, partial [Nitrospirae bacterium]